MLDHEESWTFQPRWSLRRLPKALLLAVVAGLLLLAAFLLFNRSADASDGDVGDYLVFLPLLGKPAEEPPGESDPGPYAAALSAALESCQSMGLDEVCYGSGAITLQGTTGGAPFASPGDIAPLDDVQGLIVDSPDADPQLLSVAVLRLRAASETPDKALTLLLFGDAQIGDLQLHGALPGDDALLPALTFGGGAVEGGPAPFGGLLVYNPEESEQLSLSVNGAVMTLASSALIQAQPAAQMTVTMATGSALVDGGGGSNVTIQDHQLSAPLDQAGAVSGPPGEASFPDADLLAPLRPPDDISDLLVPLVPPRRTVGFVELAERQVARFNSAYDRCLTTPDSRQVYRLFYFARVVQGYVDLFLLDEDILPDLAEKMRRCASFELDFNSTIVGTGAISWDMHLNSQGHLIQFGLQGEMIQAHSAPLTHLHYELTGYPEAPGCTTTLVKEDGVVHIPGARMRIWGNTLRIETTLTPIIDQEHLHVSCPGTEYDLPLAPWLDQFMLLHQAQRVVTGWRFADWQYNGGLNFAEAIYDDMQGQYAGSATVADTWLNLVHAPER